MKQSSFTFAIVSIACALAAFAVDLSAQSALADASPDIIASVPPTYPPSLDTTFWGTVILACTQIIVQVSKRWVVPAIPRVWIPIACAILGPCIDLLLQWGGGGGVHNPILAALISSANVVIREIYDQMKKAMSGT